MKSHCIVIKNGKTDNNKELPKIVTAINKGSVITKDAGVALFANPLATIENQKTRSVSTTAKRAGNLFLKATSSICRSLIAIAEKNKTEFIELINARISGLEKESQIKRINKVLRDVEKA